MRKLWIGLPAVLLLAGGMARAEVTAEAIPPEFLQQFAPFAMQLIQQQFPNPAVKVDAHAEKTVGYHVMEKVAVVMMPDRNLTARAIDELADKELPVAIMATRSLSVQETVQEKEATVPADRLAIADFNGMFKIPVFFLAVKSKGADRTLEVYSKDGKALSSVPLKKQVGNTEVPVGLKLANVDLEKKVADVIIQLSGAYEATFKVGIVEL